MQRLRLTPRPHWEDIATQNGFIFHHARGEIYWDESAYYSFSLKEIEEDLERPAQTLYAMCLDLVAEACANEELLLRLGIPPPYWDLIHSSWIARDKSIYGRFDLRYSGAGPAKLLEFNADTPTSLYESAFFQWLWLEDVFPDLDQFNTVQEKLCSAFSAFAGKGSMHFACVRQSAEDFANMVYMMDCAAQSGVDVAFIYMEDIGLDSGGGFVDLNVKPIQTLFKLYPWEFIWTDEFGGNVLEQAKRDLKLIEPPWKMILSNKGILPLLWQRHPGHPNLLPAWFAGQTPLCASYVAKPLLGREGANVGIYVNGALAEQTRGIYGQEGFILQEFCPLPDYDGNFPVCGVWIADGIACGLGIREDKSRITGDLSRFVPHGIG